MCFITIQSTNAANIAVHPGDSIQNAVNKAINGDTIIVYDNQSKGYTYLESVTINKKINIKSSGNVTIQAKNVSSSVFTISKQGSGSSIQNFILTKTSYAIVVSANNCLISGNKISLASLVGIQFYGNINNTKITNNNLTGLIQPKETESALNQEM